MANLFRNKKAYIDFTDLIESKNEKASIQALEKYTAPGQYVIGSVIKSRNASNIQISLKDVIQVEETQLRVGQVIAGVVKSKEELGCHLTVKGFKKMKGYLPKQMISEDAFEKIQEGKQIITVIKEIE